ncbi:Ricin B lectin (plasmid) [Ruminococcus albus 7 = DSM 20455]|uniref:Ricin B lectin n=2 Tax=Ruminococcus albus TaxID=1264 RepID=E6UJE6_RUMA7|nr:Ricin B lectin [Ruminococcus albus 7 = DSM 20455]
MSLMMICSLGVYLPNKVITNLAASAITQSEFDSKLSSLRSAYPNYSTWNDRFDGGTQCFGFARLIAYNVFGSHVSSWTKSYSISEVKAGDVIQYGNTMGSGHTIFVTSVSGDTITFVDCNGNGNYSGGSKVRSCGIKWDNTISKSAMMFGRYSFAYLYSSPSKEPSNHSPVGYVDLVEGGEGSIHVRGWVYDPDSSSQSLEVHVYIGGNVGESSIITRQTGVMANQYREDVNSTFGITGNHGFDQWIETTARGSQPVYIHVVDANDSNGNTAVRRDNQFCFTVNINEKQGHVMSESEAAGQTVPDGNYLIISELGRRVYLDIPGTKYPADEQEKLIATEGSILPNKDYDSWTVTYLNNGFYKITQNGQNIALDVPGASLNHKTKVQTYKDNATFAQQWSIKPTNHGYTIQSRANGYYLDVKNAIIGDTGYIQTHEANDSKAQSWCFIPYISNDRPIADGTYYIKSACGVWLDADGDHNYKNGSNIQIQNSKNSSDTFEITYVADGYYKIIESSSHLSLDVEDSDATAFLHKNNIQLWEYNPSNKRGQLWRIQAEGEGYYRLISKLSGYSVDLAGMQTANSSNVQQHPYNTTNAQKWSFEKVDTEPPKISDVKVTDVSCTGYTITCKVTDDGGSGLDRVQFPTWTIENNQDDIQPSWETNSKASGTIDGDIVTYRVNVNDHNNEFGVYRTHIYAYDKVGNASEYHVDDVYIDNTVPVNEKPTVSYLPGDGCVMLTWSENKGAEKYAVCGYVNNRWQKLADGNGTSYTLRNLKAGTNYRVAVIVMINGKWKQDFSNAITITPNEAKISKYPIVTSEVSGNQFRLKWSPVDGAEKYGIAVFLSGKWKVQDYMPGNSSTYTSKKIPSGTYKAVLCAKVNGEWDTSNINSRAFEIVIK